MNTPTPDQIREALAFFMRHAPDCTCDPAMGTDGECAFRDWVQAETTLESALAQPASEASPPPASSEDAAVEEALRQSHHPKCASGGGTFGKCTCHVATLRATLDALRSQVAAKEAEAARAWDEAAQERKRARDWESAHDARKVERDEARAALAAKDAEIAVLSKDLGRAATAANEWEVERDALKAQLAAAVGSALAPPPVEDAAVEEALGLLARPCPGWTREAAKELAVAEVRAALASLRSQVADKEALLCSGCGEQRVCAALCGPCSALAAKAQLAAKEAEIERLTVLLGQTMSVYPDPDALNESRRVLAQAERNYQQVQLAAAENRGFRAAAEWLGDPDLGSPVVDRGWNEARAALRAEADRREGK